MINENREQTCVRPDAELKTAAVAHDEADSISADDQ